VGRGDAETGVLLKVAGMQVCRYASQALGGSGDTVGAALPILTSKPREIPNRAMLRKK
jgi:hypothetical protein